MCLTYCDFELEKRHEPKLYNNNSYSFFRCTEVHARLRNREDREWATVIIFPIPTLPLLPSLTMYVLHII